MISLSSVIAARHSFWRVAGVWLLGCSISNVGRSGRGSQSLSASCAWPPKATIASSFGPVILS